MKKVLKVVGIVILVLLCLVLILTKFLGNRPVAPANYRKTVTTGGEIEAEYMKNGLYTVLEHEDQVLQKFGKYITYSPSELTSSNQKLPVIVLCNGSGTLCQSILQSQSIMRHGDLL